MTVLTSPSCVSGRETPASPVLSITHGLHQGGRSSLDAAHYSLGCDAENDFILTDAGVAPQHVLLRLADAKVAVEALGGEVRVEDRHGRVTRVPAGSGYRGPLPLCIGLGEARLRLDPSLPARAAPAEPLAWMDRPRLLLALGLMLICAFAFAWRAEPGTPQANVAAQPSHAAQLAPIAEARQWLEKQLQANGFKAIGVSEAGGQLVVTGRHEAAQKSAWVALRQAFDQRYGQQVMLHSAVTAQTDAAKPRVYLQAVWLGHEPYVVGEGGKRLYPGAALADGWMLERIEANQVVLARGEERFTFTL